jgi:hypothetical protein
LEGDFLARTLRKVKEEVKGEFLAKPLRKLREEKRENS